MVWIPIQTKFKLFRLRVDLYQIARSGKVLGNCHC